MVNRTLRGICVWSLILIGVLSSVASSQAQENNLRLNDIYSLAVSQNPRLQSDRERIDVKKGQKLQAGLRPNPSLQAEAENFEGSGRFEGTESLEQKYVLRYMIETWSKRDLRSEVSSLDVEIAKSAYQATKFDVLAEAKKAFYGVLAAQRRVELRENLVQLADTGVSTVSKRVEAGDVSSLEKVKAQVEQSKANIALKQARRNLESARQQLASSWGADSIKNRNVAGNITFPEQPAKLKTYRKQLQQNPVLQAARQTIEKQNASVNLARARRIPNVTVGGGYKDVESTDDYAYILNVSLPLPFFDRNQGNIQATRNRLQSARRNYDSLKIRLFTELKTHYETLTATYEELTDLKNKVIPGAKRAYEASLKGFKAGKFDYLTVLDAQRTLAENRIQYVESLKTFYRTKAEVERLTTALAENTDSETGSDDT